MAAFPDYIWRNVVKYLPFKDLGSYISSHRHAREILGESGARRLKPCDTFFTGYEWANIAKSYGRTPVLIFIDEDKDKPYVYLCFTRKEKDSGAQETDEDIEEVEKKNEDLFQRVKTSLRPASLGGHHCEVDFKELTLNISNVCYYGKFILCKGVSQKFSKNSLVAVVYGKSPRDIKPKVFRSEMAVVHIKGFDPVFFWD
jgi:hypothetical protein